MEPEPPPDHVVATYEEIRERFGLGGTDQARIKAKRRRWPLEPRNDPGALARVRVPRKDWDTAGQSDRSPDQSRTYKALEGIAPAFREERDRLIAEWDRERDRADKAEQRAEWAEGESATLREQVAAERARTAQAEREREDARVRAAAAEGEAKGLREALAEARRPFWRRWLGT
jgi:hypothetical protein